MKSRPVIPREVANRDVEDAIDYYLTEAGEQAALCFVDALERAYTRLSHQPAGGSPRYSYELNIPELRCSALSGYPYLIFYIERTDHVDVWRVLHGQRDIPNLIEAPE